MEPFDSYPKKGRELTEKITGGACRRGYGRKFIKNTKQKKCAYCGENLVAEYKKWLNMAIDHVIPVNLCNKWRLQEEWIEDYANKVLACNACNSFCNRYEPPKAISRPKTLKAFFVIRNKIYQERKKKILDKHIEEREFFKKEIKEKGKNE